MTHDEAKKLQLEIWQQSANELNQCSVEPGEEVDEWVVQLVWKDGRRERHPSLAVEMREAVSEADLREIVAKTDKVFRELDD